LIAPDVPAFSAAASLAAGVAIARRRCASSRGLSLRCQAAIVSLDGTPGMTRESGVSFPGLGLATHVFLRWKVGRTGQGAERYAPGSFQIGSCHSAELSLMRASPASCPLQRKPTLGQGDAQVTPAAPRNTREPRNAGTGKDRLAGWVASRHDSRLYSPWALATSDQSWLTAQPLAGAVGARWMACVAEVGLPIAAPSIGRRYRRNPSGKRKIPPAANQLTADGCHSESRLTFRDAIFHMPCT